MRWLQRLLGRFRNKDDSLRRVPSSLQDLKSGDPCWCGSGKRYRKCHRADDQRRLREACRGVMPLSRNPFV